jgi:hypothetical protein
VNGSSRLAHFLGAYFHEDWPEEADDPVGVVERYLLDHESPSERRMLADDIERFVKSIEDDASLAEALFKELLCYYDPSADNQTAREWLTDIVTLLRQRAGQA